MHLSGCRVALLRGLKLRETLSQFSHTMTAQTDLRVEAAHLARFAAEFAHVRSQVRPSWPPGLILDVCAADGHASGNSMPCLGPDAGGLQPPLPFTLPWQASKWLACGYAFGRYE